MSYGFLHSQIFRNDQRFFVSIIFATITVFIVFYIYLIQLLTHYNIYLFYR